MSRIKILPEPVKNKIAAGEVVEGPFSVIKELMENSIDAEAKEIDVEVFDSGLKRISVRDNGKGIYREDLPLAVRNHATSKISDIADIERISSYGFRGEALASIASISRLTIFSRSAEEDMGAKLVSENGPPEITDYAGHAGTAIIVENLFYNIPARKKFLSSKSAEQRKIREIFLKTALASPGIGFSLSIDGKRAVTLTAVNKIEERIAHVYGKSAMENLNFERLKDIRAEISGFLSAPGYLKSSRSMQILYVNNRLVDYRYLGFFLSKAYQAIAQKGAHPAAIIFINIDPELVDVNIHPAKKEVKFFDRNYINNLILNLCKKSLDRIHTLNAGRFDPAKKTGQVQTPAGNRDNHEQQELIFAKSKDAFAIQGKPGGSYAAQSGYSFRSFISDAGKLYNEIERQYDFKYHGVIFDTYIVVEKDDGLIFIDYHAAHERVVYDALAASGRQPEMQSLIFPQVVELSIEDFQIFLEKKEYFTDTAFDIDVFADNSIVVRGIPDILKNMNIEGFISDIIESVKLDRDHVLDMKKTIAQKAACHSAMRSGDPLTAEDAKMIAEAALSGDYERRCPHGRPYMFRLGKNDLEKVFKRS